MLDKAREFAINAHRGQEYGEGRPYTVHLEAVVKLLEPYGEEAQMVGYLHDVLEDTGVNVQTLEHEFGASIAKYVAMLTDEPGEFRQDRKKATYAKLKAVGQEDELSLLVLAADRLANIQASITDGRKGNDKLKMYRKEQDDFKDAVYRSGLCEDLWAAIDTAVGDD